ncbi:flagellin N-terminal helical domain-containing protein [Azospirillum doebereinerae]
MTAIDLQLPATMRSNLLAIQVTQERMSVSQQRLATGMKVNTALDSPPVFFAARGLTQRAGDLTMMKDAMGQAISTVKAADKGVTGISSLLQQARGVATAALASLGADDASIRTRAALAGQFDTILDQINGIAGDAGYGGKNLLVGDGSKLAVTQASKQEISRIVGVKQAQVSDITKPDAYQIRVTGDGRISGDPEDISLAEHQLGLSDLSVTGQLDGRNGNFNGITVSIAGSPGRDKQITVEIPPETFTQVFTVDDWKAATDAGTALQFTHGFESGARVAFDVDFDQIDATPQNVGLRTAQIEKHADLAVLVTNNQGLTMARDLQNPLGQGKLAAGVNDFVFPSGTVRVNVDPTRIIGDNDSYDSGYRPSVEPSAFDQDGMPILATAGVPPQDAAKNLDVPESVGLSFMTGVPDSAAPGYRNFYVVESNFNSITTVAVPNSATKEFPVTLGPGGGANSGSTIYVNVSAYDPSLSYSPNTPGNSLPLEPLNVTGCAIATSSPILQYDTGRPVGINSITLGPGSVDGFTPGVNTKLTTTWGALDSAGPGRTKFTVTDDAGRSFETSLENTSSATESVSVKFPVQGQYPESSFQLLVNQDMTVNPTGGSMDFKILWPEGVRPTATLKTDLVTAANHANDLFVALDAARTNGVTVEAQNLMVEGAGLHVDRSQNAWVDRADIENAMAGLDTAEQRVRSASQALSTNMSIVTTRQDWTKEFSDVLAAGADKLTLADQNEEGSNLLMLQTRQQLAQTALGMANQSQQAILSLFR